MTGLWPFITKITEMACWLLLPTLLGLCCCRPTVTRGRTRSRRVTCLRPNIANTTLMSPTSYVLVAPHVQQLCLVRPGLQARQASVGSLLQQPTVVQAMTRSRRVTGLCKCIANITQISSCFLLPTLLGPCCRPTVTQGRTRSRRVTGSGLQRCTGTALERQSQMCGTRSGMTS